MSQTITIEVFRGGNKVDVRTFDEEVIKIGRLATATLHLDDPSVYRIHAVLQNGEQVVLSDMGSPRGTVVNGERVTRQVLTTGSRVQLGDSELHIKWGAAAAEPAPVPMAIEMGAGTQDPAPTLQTVPPPESPPAPGGPSPTEPSTSTPPTAGVAAPAEVTAIVQRPAPVVPAAVSIPPIPEDPITDGNRYIELTIRWGAHVIAVHRLRDEKALSAGPDDCEVFLDAALCGGQAFNMLEQVGSGWRFRFPTVASGQVVRNGEAVSLQAAGASPDGPVQGIDVRDGDTVSVTAEHLRFDVRTVSKSRPVPVPTYFDALWANTLVLTLFVFLVLWAALVFMPHGLNEDDDALFTNAAEFQLIIMKPQKKDNQFLEKLKMKVGNKSAKKAKGREGKMGKKKAPKADARAATKAKEKPTDEAVVAKKLNALFGAEGTEGVASVFGAASSGGALEGALGNISGTRVGTSGGSGGLGVRGGLPGGGGTGTGTFGGGDVGTVGRGTGRANYGGAGGNLGARKDRAIRITQGRPIIRGSLPPEVIRRIVRENQAQIRYCYERQLNRKQGLGGKVMVQWVIAASGRVKTAKTKSSTVKNRAMESCLERKVKSWRFPKPKGGGIVVVNYPFVFKSN